MSAIGESDYKLVETLWLYNRLGHAPQAADFLIVMGTNDLRVPEYAAGLFLTLSYKAVVVSGGVFHERSCLGEPFGGTEAATFYKILLDRGVAPESVLIEDRASNTGENITFSRQILQEARIKGRTGHLVHTPSMERRALATAQRQWPEIEWSVSSPPLSFEADMGDQNEGSFINGLVGDTFRILSYPAQGFQMPQDMPEDVHTALAKLIELGFTKRIPSDYKSFLDRAD